MLVCVIAGVDVDAKSNKGSIVRVGEDGDVGAVEGVNVWMVE